MLTSPTLAALPTIAREESEGEANPARSKAEIVCPEWDGKEVRFPPFNTSLPSPSKAGTCWAWSRSATLGVPRYIAPALDAAPVCHPATSTASCVCTEEYQKLTLNLYVSHITLLSLVIYEPFKDKPGRPSTQANAHRRLLSERVACSPLARAAQSSA